MDKDVEEYGLEEKGMFYAHYKGTVHDNKDPENLGRIIVRVPAVYGENIHEYWALPKGMFAGKGISSFFIPNEGDSVWVVFENGDPRFPVWDYGWFRSGDVPEGASVDNKVIQTTSGHRIEIDDKNALIRISDTNDNVVELNKEGISIGSQTKSDEPAVVGDTLMDLLKEFTDDIGALKAIQTSSGITYEIQTSPMWLPFKEKWSQKWEEFKSKKVTLDK